MPEYDYECDKCGHRWAVICKISEHEPEPACPREGCDGKGEQTWLTGRAPNWSFKLVLAALVFMLFGMNCDAACTGFGKEYQGECWNRYTWFMTPQEYVYDISPRGELIEVPQSRQPRQMALYQKAQKILYDSPADAPLAEIYLVWEQLKVKLNLIPDYRKQVIANRRAGRILWREP